MNCVPEGKRNARSLSSVARPSASVADRVVRERHVPSVTGHEHAPPDERAGERGEATETAARDREHPLRPSLRALGAHLRPQLGVQRVDPVTQGSKEHLSLSDHSRTSSR